MVTAAGLAGPLYRVAIIGAGKAGQPSAAKGGGHQIGYLHAQMYQRNPRTVLVAVADISPENLHAFQQRFHVGKGFLDYREMLAAVQPDIVSICTYVGLHRTMIEAAAQAGVKGIICEKPFLASPAECAAVRAVAKATGVKIVVPHFRRYWPVFAQARERYNDGTVGAPLLCLAGLEGWDLAEWGSHWLDMFRFFHQDQPVRWVFGQVRVRALRGYGHAMEDHGVAYCEFANGGRALLDGGRGLNGDATMVLVGTQGTLRIIGHTLSIEAAQGRRMEAFDHLPLSRTLVAWDRMLADLLLWLEGGPEPMLGLSNMLQSCELMLAAYLSALRGDRVDLPLADSLAEWPVELLARRWQGEKGVLGGEQTG